MPHVRRKAGRRERRAAFEVPHARIAAKRTRFRSGPASLERRRGSVAVGLRQRPKTQAIFASMMGTLVLARAVDDAALSDDLLAAGRRAVLLLADRKH